MHEWAGLVGAFPAQRRWTRLEVDRCIRIGPTHLKTDLLSGLDSGQMGHVKLNKDREAMDEPLKEMWYTSSFDFLKEPSEGLLSNAQDGFSTLFPGWGSYY